MSGRTQEPAEEGPLPAFEYTLRQICSNYESAFILGIIVGILITVLILIVITHPSAACTGEMCL